MTQETGARRTSTARARSTTGERATFAAVADHLIPAAHGMPSAADVVTDDRLRFVLRARPDLAEPLKAALRPSWATTSAQRLERARRDEPANLGGAPARDRRPATTRTSASAS